MRSVSNQRLDAALRRWGGERSRVALAAIVYQWRAIFWILRSENRVDRINAQGSFNAMIMLQRIAQRDVKLLTQLVLLKWSGGGSSGRMALEAEDLRKRMLAMRLRHSRLLDRATGEWGARDAKSIMIGLLAAWQRAAARARSVAVDTRRLEEQVQLQQALRAAEQRAEQEVQKALRDIESMNAWGTAVEQQLVIQALAFEKEAEECRQDSATSAAVCDILEENSRVQQVRLDELEREVELLRAHIAGVLADQQQQAMSHAQQAQIVRERPSKSQMGLSDLVLRAMPGER